MSELRGRSARKIIEPRGCRGVVEASLKGGLEGSLSIFVGGLLEKIVIRILSFPERGWGGILVPAPTQPPEEDWGSLGPPRPTHPTPIPTHPQGPTADDPSHPIAPPPLPKPPNPSWVSHPPTAFTTRKSVSLLR